MEVLLKLLLVAGLPISIAGCGKSGDGTLADRVENHAYAQADALKNQAAELNAQAKQVRATGKQRGEAIDAADLNTQAMSNGQKAAIVNGIAPAVR